MSAVAGAAYRAGEALADERTGEDHDYTRRAAVDHTEILAPAAAPSWVQDRGRLWNEVETAEKRSNSRVAREIIVALPKELTPDQQRQLVRGFVAEATRRRYRSGRCLRASRRPKDRPKRRASSCAKAAGFRSRASVT